MANLRDTGGTEKLRRLMQTIKSAAAGILTKVGENLALQASERAPSPEQEFQVMMYGEGNPYGVPEDSAGSSFGEDSDGDGRARFIKPPELYLRNWIRNDIHQDGLHVGVGWQTDLDTISSYSWKNRGGTYTTTFGFYQAWELGGSFMVAPRFSRKDGGDYPLRPSVAKQEPPLFQMTKVVPRLRIFGGVEIETEVQNTLIPMIRRAARQAQ